MNMINPMFSIIIPIYNVEQYLNECVDSLLSQTYDNFEIILVDDGSPDNCPKICDEYAKKDNRVRVIHKQNQGVAIARQVGGEIAIGDYFMFVDGDDYLLPNTLLKISKIIKEYSVDIVAFSIFDPVRRNGRIRKEIGYFSKKDIEEKIFPTLLESMDGRYFEPAIYLNATKRNLYMHNAVQNKIIAVGEDLACTKACVFSANSIYFIPEALYFYRYRSDSVTVSKKAFPWDGPELIGKHLEEKIDMKVADMKAQLYRVVTHQLFLVAKSQFSRNENYFKISKEIKENLKNPYYKNAIDQCEYKNYIKGILARYALKHKLTFLMFLFCKLGF